MSFLRSNFVIVLASFTVFDAGTAPPLPPQVQVREPRFEAATVHPSEPTAAAAGGRPFDGDSAWNMPIGVDPVLDPRSSEIAAAISTHPGIANVYAYGVPVYDAVAGTPRYAVGCTNAWGTCPFAGRPVPIPDGAAPSTGSDAAMVVVDRSTDTLYEFYQYDWNQGNPMVAWGAVGPVTGSGRDNEDGRIGNSTGAGVSRLAGVIRTWEVEQGVIEHALVFSSRFCEAPASSFRYPATKSDGKYRGTGSIPEGARIQLDPAVDMGRLKGIRPFERMVAKALQTYGAYVIDCGGANAAFIFEKPSGEADPYPAAGLTSDYFAMTKIPWSRIRVLQE